MKSSPTHDMYYIFLKYAYILMMQWERWERKAKDLGKKDNINKIKSQQEKLVGPMIILYSDMKHINYTTIHIKCK